jgi:hypothetical protein
VYRTENKARVSLLRKRKPKREITSPSGEKSKVRVSLVRKKNPKREITSTPRGRVQSEG